MHSVSQSSDNQTQHIITDIIQCWQWNETKRLFITEIGTGLKSVISWFSIRWLTEYRVLECVIRYTGNDQNLVPFLGKRIMFAHILIYRWNEIMNAIFPVSNFTKTIPVRFVWVPFSFCKRVFLMHTKYRSVSRFNWIRALAYLMLCLNNNHHIRWWSPFSAFLLLLLFFFPNWKISKNDTLHKVHFGYISPLRVFLLQIWI